jgi:hypothetical protein
MALSGWSLSSNLRALFLSFSTFSWEPQRGFPDFDRKSAKVMNL